MAVIKSPRKHIFISLWLHAKYNSQLIAPDLRGASKNPTLLYVKDYYCKGNCWKSLAAAKLRLQYIKNELLLIMCNSWFSSISSRHLERFLASLYIEQNIKSYTVLQ